MLSSLPGSAISWLRLTGILHEFSSIPGVKEDVTGYHELEISGNQSTSESDEPKTAYIEFEGRGVVAVADIPKVVRMWEIMNRKL